jgi:sec-independent protein translocase protein TatB
MMPGIGFEEMAIFVLLAIVVIGPKDLPLMMRKFGRFTGKMRAMAFEFKQGFDELGRQAELEELRKEVADLKKHTGLEELQNDLRQDQINLEKDVTSALEAPAAAHPAAASAQPAPYAGLSAEHPGYDAGDDFRIDGSLPPPPAETATVEVNGVNGVHADAHEEANGVHVIPDDEVREPAPPSVPPIKQDAPA